MFYVHFTMYQDEQPSLELLVMEIELAKNTDLGGYVNEFALEKARIER